MYSSTLAFLVFSTHTRKKGGYGGWGGGGEVATTAVEER
jgi:hypothetical protein